MACPPDQVPPNTILEDSERIEIYDFEAKYSGEAFDLEGFYHVPRYHWRYEGDFFGLVHEATDIYGMDIWNAKAPEGIEIRGKDKWSGLTILAGPEVYWGANPKAIVKYEFETDNIDWAVMHAEDIAQRDDSSSATEPTERSMLRDTMMSTMPVAMMATPLVWTASVTMLAGCCSRSVWRAASSQA